MLASGCELGEGLWVKEGKAAWVDINKGQLIACMENTLNRYSIRDKPSIVYKFEENEVIMGSDKGITLFNTITIQEVLLSEVSNIHHLEEYRSNDGGFCGDHQLLSFMHKTDPENNLGFVYRVSKKSFLLIDNSLHIPNSFIEIEPSTILISDSLKGQIWLYLLDKSGNVVKKILWAQMEAGIAPDGGCLVGDLIFLALWDGASIAVFNKGGKLLKMLTLPIIRPTNCKFDESLSQLWVTSACEGLSEEQMSLYPDSGNTLVYDMKLGSKC